MLVTAPGSLLPLHPSSLLSLYFPPAHPCCYNRHLRLTRLFTTPSEYRSSSDQAYCHRLSRLLSPISSFYHNNARSRRSTHLLCLAYIFALPIGDAVIVLSASLVGSQPHLSTVHRQTKLIAFRFARCLLVLSTTTVTTSFHSVCVCSQSISWCLTNRCCMSPSAPLPLALPLSSPLPARLFIISPSSPSSLFGCDCYFRYLFRSSSP